MFPGGSLKSGSSSGLMRGKLLTRQAAEFSDPSSKICRHQIPHVCLIEAGSWDFLCAFFAIR